MSAADDEDVDDDGDEQPGDAEEPSDEDDSLAAWRCDMQGVKVRASMTTALNGPR